MQPAELERHATLNSAEPAKLFVQIAIHRIQYRPRARRYQHAATKQTAPANGRTATVDLSDHPHSATQCRSPSPVSDAESRRQECGAQSGIVAPPAFRLQSGFLRQLQDN